MDIPQNLGQNWAHCQNDLIWASGEMVYLSPKKELVDRTKLWPPSMLLRSSILSFSACEPNAKPVLRRHSKALRYAGTFPKKTLVPVQGSFLRNWAQQDMILNMYFN